MKTVFIGDERGNRAMSVKDNAKAYAHAADEKLRPGNRYAFVADKARNKFEEARIDGGVVTWHRVANPDFSALRFANADGRK